MAKFKVFISSVKYSLRKGKLQKHLAEKKIFRKTPPQKHCQENPTELWNSHLELKCLSSMRIEGHRQQVEISKGKQGEFTTSIYANLDKESPCISNVTNKYLM